MCTMGVNKAIDYYVDDGSPMFCIMLDATKAFDGVHLCELFNLLIDKNLPFATLRLLLNMHTGHVILKYCGMVFSRAPFWL